MGPSTDPSISSRRGRPFTIEPLGCFSLEEAAMFGFAQRAGVSHFDGVMRLAFCLDGFEDQVGVQLRQDATGVHGWVQGSADVAAVRAQVARVLSLDHDGRIFAEVGRRDPVIGRLQAVAPGLRPPLFHSPYEAAAWCVLSARRPAASMAALRQRLSAAHGGSFEVAGEHWSAFPTPAQLLEIKAFPDIPEVKLRRLHGVAAAALDGRLDPDLLRTLGLDEGIAHLQELEGIGPFYAGLIMIRATGLADVLPVGESHLDALVGELYHLEAPPTWTQLQAIAEPWRPLRTWAAVLIRAASRRRASGVAPEARRVGRERVRNQRVRP